MKSLRLFFLSSVLLFASFCSSNKKENSAASTYYIFEESDSEDLIMDISVRKPDLAIGFGNVYNCVVNKIEKGFVEDSIFSMTILGGEPEKDSLFIAASANKNILKIGFKKHRDNEPYRMSPINGFVDGDNTSWRMTYITVIENNSVKPNK